MHDVSTEANGGEEPPCATKLNIGFNLRCPHSQPIQKNTQNPEKYSNQIQKNTQQMFSNYVHNVSTEANGGEEPPCATELNIGFNFHSPHSQL